MTRAVYRFVRDVPASLRPGVDAVEAALGERGGGGGGGPRLAWAAEVGVPVPRTVGEGAGWLATEIVANDPPAGPGFVEAALRTARAIAGAPAPPAALLEGSRGRHPSR